MTNYMNKAEGQYLIQTMEKKSKFKKMAKHLSAVMARDIGEMILIYNPSSLLPNIWGHTRFSVFIFWVKDWQEVKLAYKSHKGKVF